MNENIYSEIFHELYRFPYLQDKNRNEKEITRLIQELFNCGTSMAIEYPGGYFIMRRIANRTADLFWIHMRGRGRFGHTWIRVGRRYLDGAMRLMDLERLTLRTVDPKVVKAAKLLGFETEATDKSGFVWHGKALPMFYMAKER
jgi:hypothetical protein